MFPTSLVFHGHCDIVVRNSCLWSMLAPLLPLVGREDVAISCPLSFPVLCDTLTPHSLPLATLWLFSPRKLWIFPILDILLSVMQSGTLCIWFPSHSMFLRTLYYIIGQALLSSWLYNVSIGAHAACCLTNISAQSRFPLWRWSNQTRVAALG